MSSTGHPYARRFLCWPTFTNVDGHPFLARIMFLNSIIPNSFKMKKGEDRETKRKKGRRRKEGGREKGREGRKQRKSKRKEGKKNNGIKQTGRASRRKEVPNKASLRRTLRITKAGPLHFVYLLRCQGQNERSQSSDLPYHQEVGSLAGEHHCVFFWLLWLARLIVGTPTSPSPSINPKDRLILPRGEAELSFGVLFPTGHTEGPQRTKIQVLPQSRSALILVQITDEGKGAHPRQRHRLRSTVVVVSKTKILNSA